MDRFLNTTRLRRGVAGGAHHQGHIVRWILQRWNKDRGLRSFAEALLANVASNADDFHWVGNVPTNVELLPQRILPWKNFRCERLRNHHHARSRDAIAPAELASGGERHSH